MVCSEFSEAQVVKSFLMAQGFHPRVRDEQTRSVAPHFGQLLGKLTLEIPEAEYMAASQALENREQQSVRIVTEIVNDTEGLAKKALWNAILGCTLVPVICNLYSMILGYRVLKAEIPLGKVSRKRLLWAIVFNSLSFYGWLVFGAKWLRL